MALHWQQIESLLDHVLDLEPEAQAAYLDAHCPDPEVRRYIEDLIRADADAPAFLDEDAVRFASPLLEAEPMGLGERQVGPYRLVRELGRGGMGIVYLAAHDDLDRQVALKLVRGGLADPTATARFLHERRVLARLEHPNIARLYDVGVTDDGTPYFAMEWVEGTPLTDFCDAHRLDITARLRLFEAVGRAVQHAHQHFIVHRDLKPSNILVAEETSDKPQVKLLDFGIAKVLAEAEEAITAPQTETAFRRMTLAYAAPEQVQGTAITTATDVYSLGVVLYELLTGQRPYAIQGSGLEAAQAVLTQEPKRPSTILTGNASTTETAKARATTVDQLSRRLQGDLDVICLKALAKEPERRYASAEAFVEDIRRHLAGLPVAARPATARYRVRKFVQRHLQGVFATAAAVGLLALVVTFYTSRLQTERDAAQQEAYKAEQVAAFMADLFSASNPWEEVQGDTLRARDLLQRGATRLETELADEPEVQARMMQHIGDLYQQLGLYDEATRLLAQALAIQRETLGPTHPDVARTLRGQAWVAFRQGHFSLADSLAQRALTIDESTLGTSNLSVAKDLDVMALARNEQGDYAAAESLHQHTLALRQQGGATEVELAQNWHELASSLASQGDYAAAESLEQVALGLYRAHYDPNHPSIAEALSNLAAFAGHLGKLDDAETYNREAIAIKRSVLPPDHPNLAMTLSNLGVVVGMLGRYDEAGELMREGLRIRRARFGDNHPLVASALRNLAQLAIHQGDLPLAETYALEALATTTRAFGPHHPSVSATEAIVGDIRLDRGDFAGAEQAYRSALAVDRAALGPDHATVGGDLHYLATALLQQQHYAEADSLFQQALAIRRASLGEDHPNNAPTLRNLGRLYGETGRFAEGEPLLLEALQLQVDGLGPDHPYIPQTRQVIADFYRAWGKPDEAAKYVE